MLGRRSASGLPDRHAGMGQSVPAPTESSDDSGIPSGEQNTIAAIDRRGRKSLDLCDVLKALCLLGPNWSSAASFGGVPQKKFIVVSGLREK